MAAGQYKWPQKPAIVASESLVLSTKCNRFQSRRSGRFGKLARRDDRPKSSGRKLAWPAIRRSSWTTQDAAAVNSDLMTSIAASVMVVVVVVVVCHCRCRCRRCRVARPRTESVLSLKSRQAWPPATNIISASDRRAWLISFSAKSKGPFVSS